jgi:hypothetical protein
MGIRTWVTGGSNTADKIIDSIVKTGDALFYTKAERSEFDMQRQALWLELQKTLADESSPRSVNRRVVAWAVILMTSFMTIMCLAAAALGAHEFCANVIATATAFKWDWAFCGVIVFYFGTHMLSATVGKKS